MSAVPIRDTKKQKQKHTNVSNEKCSEKKYFFFMFVVVIIARKIN